MNHEKFQSLKLGKPSRLTGGLTNHEHPAVSADGTLLACYSGDYGDIGILLLNIEGQFIRRLSSGGNNTQPAWHPDGRSLAWRHQDSPQSPWRIVSCPILGDVNPQVILEHPQFSYKHPSYSPDGNSLAYFSDEGSPEIFHLWLLELASGERRQLTIGNTQNHCHPVYSPDGQRIIYHAYEGTGEEENPAVNLYELALDNLAVRQLTDDAHQDKHPFYLDNTVVSFHHRDNGTRIRHLELMHLPAGERLKLTDGSNNDKHAFPFRNIKGKRCLVWSSKKLGSELEGEENTYDLFVARLKSTD